jgi:hypothetical protein
MSFQLEILEAQVINYHILGMRVWHVCEFVQYVRNWRVTLIKTTDSLQYSEDKQAHTTGLGTSRHKHSDHSISLIFSISTDIVEKVCG